MTAVNYKLMLWKPSIRRVNRNSNISVKRRCRSRRRIRYHFTAA
jgi:hypothetical protein